MTKSDSKFTTTVQMVMRQHLQAALEGAYCQLYEQGYAGYPGSSQQLNIDNPFARAADALTEDALDALVAADLCPEVQDDKPEHIPMKQIPATWVPVIDEDLQHTYYDVKRMLTEQDIASRLNQYLKDGSITRITKEEFDGLVEVMDDSVDEFGYSNVSDILHDELRRRELLV